MSDKNAVKIDTEINAIKLDVGEGTSDAFGRTIDKTTGVIGDLLYLVLGDMRLKSKLKRIANDKKCRVFQETLRKEYSEINSPNTENLDYQTIALATENIQFCIHSEILQQMYATLIARCFNDDFTAYIHPSYSEILKQMSPLDAFVLSIFSDGNKHIIGKYTWYGNENNTVITKLIFIQELLENKFDIIFHQQVISSLVRLGLIEEQGIGTLGHLKEDKESPFKNTSYYQESETNRVSEGIYTKSLIHVVNYALTPLGRDFTKCCISDSIEYPEFEK